MNDKSLLASVVTVGQRIRILRRAKGLTQETLARRIHITQGAIAHWEADRYEPALQSQVLLAEALGYESLDAQ